MSSAFEQLFGKQGEVKVESLDSDKKFCTGIFQNGVFEKRVTPIGDFVRQVSKDQTLYLSQKCSPSFKLTLPKVPIGMFHAIHKFYAHVLANIKSEVAAQIFWDTVDKKYVIYVPKQTVAGASISYKRDEGYWADTRYICVVNSHSHCAFNAFFSGTDTADEVNSCTFLVLGHVNKEAPSIAFRAGCNGSFVDLQIADIFDVFDPTVYDISLDNMANLTERQHVPTTPWYAQYQKPSNVNSTSGINTSKMPNKRSGLFALPGGHYLDDDDQDYMRFMSNGSAASYFDNLDYDALVKEWESCSLDFDPVGNQQLSYNNYLKALKDFHESFVLFSKAIMEDPNAGDVGMLLISDFVTLMDGLDFAPLDTMKALFDEYDRVLKQDELNEFLSHVCHSVG